MISIGLLLSSQRFPIYLHRIPFDAHRIPLDFHGILVHFQSPSGRLPSCLAWLWSLRAGRRCLTEWKAAEAQAKAEEAMRKKREKAVMSWRSRVVTAVSQNDALKTELLLNETPFRQQDSSSNNSNADADDEVISSIQTHMTWLLPNCVTKDFFDILHSFWIIRFDLRT